ncbi:MAG: homocysteine S-methyltransferase family protein [Clostridia bacterium]|nr:homocysteine S-methyltransferase family protein [Clostridia bacterium]
MFKTHRFLIVDGGMGTMLQSKGLKAGEQPELFMLKNKEVVTSVHKEYVEAGADIITTCTFGANKYKLGSDEKSREVILCAVECAKNSGAKYVALDIGPCGSLLEPIGSLTFEDAYDSFAAQVKAGVEAGADLVIVETMSDLLEIKAAILAVKENSSLPVIATMTFEKDGKTFLGTDAKTAAIALTSFGADAVGVNCSLGPEELSDVIDEFILYAGVPVAMQPNAGLPVIENGETVFKITPEEFAEKSAEKAKKGVLIFGGCCGTTPAHIKALADKLKDIEPVKLPEKHFTSFTSGRETVILDGKNSAVIGERINPTGKKKLKEALRNKNYDYVINEALNQENCGADALDVNAGLPEIDEKETLVAMVKEIQAICSLPLQIDSSDPEVVEAAVRIYNGKPIINSVNGTEDSMAKILPIVKKYGTAVVALTLDDSGIPKKAEERLRVAEKIISRAEAMGISRDDIIVDCLTLTVSTSQSAVKETLKAVTLVKEKLGVRTVLGVSNVSFGMPNRELINASFLAEAYGAGLDMPILNPLSEKYREIIAAHKVINNEDVSGKDFIEKYGNVEKMAAPVKADAKKDLKDIIISGIKGEAKSAVAELLKEKTPLQIINGYFIPALDVVGEGFEKGKMFLPQLMASAQAVKNGFEAISETMGVTTPTKGKIILATVKGDIHDIGKNIVKMLLENYGYDVIDLGRDVAPETVVKAQQESGAKLVGLSALMTTTVKSMKDTIDALKVVGADCKVMVGGAVLNEEYAQMVGADYYVSDATHSARVAAEVLKDE